MRCSACQAENPDGARFCEDCGSSLALACPSCGATITPGKRFCRECGAALTDAVPAQSAPAVATGPVAERRVVSVLFADLVGFTPLSESRDPEEVRELLSRYFATARTVVARYGGVVEKFIGDAVMAAWGVPAAHGDDAERSVRAGLDLVESVAALGADVGATGLTARAGVVTGEVAVTVGAVGEGMVAGDTVNTAARVQAAADPGTVLVDDVTRKTTTAAIAYADTGPHVLKGKADAVRLWRATRVVGAVGGTERVDGLEASFAGRDRQLRSVKEAFHGAVQDDRARLVSVVGPAGIGKSRLRWEFFKYIDGLADTVLWHSGRCLPYGEGVAYWALAEIVRARLDIAEDEPAEPAATKLTTGLQRWVAADSDREFLLPRLGVLLGITEPGLGREELFAGWRLWFERLAEHDPVVLVVEDLQWADAGLLDFLEHLLDWSADHPIFVLTLTRPELTERRPGWGAGRRNVTTLVLDELPDAVMTDLLGELVPGLPRAASERIVQQADGVPLYAVELVRSLIDRDLVQPVDGVYRLVGEITDLDVPASLTSLVAARIDALPVEERTLLQALAVLGGTFPRAAVAAVSDLPADEVDRLLSSLVRKEILGVRTDRLSPDRGQYAFTQSMLRSVAYDTLSRRDRKARHLAVAKHLRATFPDDGAEVAEVVAQHYRDAHDAVPDDTDAAEIRVESVRAFVRAGQRAMSIGAPETAERAYATAADLATGPADRAAMLDLAGQAAFQAGRYEAAVTRYETSASLLRDLGEQRAVADVTERWALALGAMGRTEQGIALVQPVLALGTAGAAEETVARLHNRLGHLLMFAGRSSDAAEHIEVALRLSQALELPEVLAEAAIIKGLLLAADDRHQEALATQEWVAHLAETHGLIRAAGAAHGNAADLALNGDVSASAIEHLDAGIALARRQGDPSGEAFCVYNMGVLDLFRGNWSAVDESVPALLGRFERLPVAQAFGHAVWAQLHARRGQLAEAHADLAALTELRDSEDMQYRAVYAMVLAMVANAEGDQATALRSASESVRMVIPTFGIRHEFVRQAWPEALDAALGRKELARAGELLAIVTARPVGHIPRYLRAQAARFRARLDAANGELAGVHENFVTAEEGLAALGYPYFLAGVRLDHARWLADQGRKPEAEALLAPTAVAFESLGAAPALARCRVLIAELSAGVTV